mmetsp:Transcript_22089/g.56223  ORF Transcript_22089/g.56223 Transcript_22089/m.56223 type:complete len:171 (+) Transcript_22089:3-515(+)
MADVLEHLLDLPRAIQQVRRVLRPGGVLVFDTINRSYKSYLLTIVLAQEAMGMVPPHTHDWRLYIKPHELGFLLQAHGFLCDTGHFRGLMPTLDPRQLLRAPPIPKPAAGWSARLPSPPLSDFVETSSLEVNYMGWAVKSELAASGEESPPKEHAPGALAKGLRDFERVS